MPGATVKAVYAVSTEAKGTQSVFRRIGTAFVNRDASLNVVLEAMPLNGKLHIRDIEPLGRPHALGEDPR